MQVGGFWEGKTKCMGCCQGEASTRMSLCFTVQQEMYVE